MINSQMTKHFTERKERKAARKEERNKKTLLRVLKRERPRRATPAHLLEKRTWPGLLLPKSTSMLRNPLPLGKMHGRKITTGTPITDAGSILSNGTTSMSRGNYFVHDGWDVRTGQQCNGVSTDFSIIGIMQCIIFLLEIFLLQMSLHRSSLLIGYANFILHQLRLILIFVSQYFAVSSPRIHATFFCAWRTAFCRRRRRQSVEYPIQRIWVQRVLRPIQRIYQKDRWSPTPRTCVSEVRK